MFRLSVWEVVCVLMVFGWLFFFGSFVRVGLFYLIFIDVLTSYCYRASLDLGII